MINSDGVQALVDLCGLHSNGTNVYAVFGDKPSPVQVVFCLPPVTCED
jgi:predicted O-linked N-acetylglucosamine transferase (SPINDLY family)